MTLFSLFSSRKIPLGDNLFFNRPSPAQFHPPHSLGRCVHDLGWDVDTDQDQRRKICGKQPLPPISPPNCQLRKFLKLRWGVHRVLSPPPPPPSVRPRHERNSSGFIKPPTSSHLSVRRRPNEKKSTAVKRSEC